jgi:hypothetical protein
MVEAGKHTPLPRPKPAIPEIAKQTAPEGVQAKNETGKPDDARPSLHRSHQPPEPISRRQARIKSKSGT